MTTTEGEPHMVDRFDPDRPIPISSPLQPSKPRSGGAKILSFLLQTLIMAVALLLFFLFAGVAALILIHLFVAGRALRRRRRRRFVLRGPDPNPEGLSVDEIKSLPSFECSDETLAALEDCTVCLEGFRDGDRCRSLPSCGHCFHVSCVDRWLVRTPACPICRCCVVIDQPEITGQLSALRL